MSSGTTSYAQGSYELGYFTLEVATGTWDVFISKNDYFARISNVVVKAGQYTGICNAATNPYYSGPEAIIKLKNE